ncbi:hypothetical protein [Larkinella rosea]|uniref:Uncharacterized protein n=1 Tax=Larkinella rosea TaxID=2025312 RepID=A0A3P1C2C1_9BACT|nr:hypothetical protein [Larkinella rosea]RRB07457.1 hypothetical protein EHT25_06660 [Larkinella rosea]
MKNNKIIDLVSQKWYRMWVILPILMYGLCIAGEGLIYYFPILLVAAQFISIRFHPLSEHSGWWWAWLLGSIFCYLIACKIFSPVITYLGVPPDYSYVKNVTLYILSFYISQMPAEIVLMLIFPQWRFGWWIFGNSLAAIGWMGAFLVLYYFTPFPYSVGDRFTFFWGFIGPSILGNAITGYFLDIGSRE